MLPNLWLIHGANWLCSSNLYKGNRTVI